MDEAKIDCTTCMATIVQWMWTQVKQDSQLNNHPSSSSCLASPSTPTPATQWKYDVFLSFRGPDTRKGITVDIRDRLQSRGIKTFMDDPDLQVGDTISPTLIAAIQESRFAVVVLSQNYASSTWCLEELVKICECMENDKSFPLFYHVDPTDVRFQNKGSFKEAFSKHERSGRHEPETVKKWRAALRQVADKSGWSSDAFKTHRELVDSIVESLSSKVPPDVNESADDFHVYEATTEAMDEVKEALRDVEITVVGVYGMGGVGKTTMVTHVAAQACRNGMFNHWIITSISQNPDLKQIQLRLSDLLGVKLGEETEEGRAARLHKEIMKREKLLIILDDVWDILELSKIGIPNSIKLQSCNSKVILTTRRSNVCHVMECQRKIILNSLSEKDSWALFVRKARCSFESPIFEGVAKKVAKECGGLPIALITVARALGDKNLKEWKRAAKRLEKSQYANPDHNDFATKCIRLSYDYLKDEECKSFFLLCCLFPEDYDIDVEDLFRYALGKGLFKSEETLEEVRDRADSLTMHLKYSSLLLDGRNNEHVKLHDVRDTAIQIAQSKGVLVKVGYGLEDWPRKVHENCTTISLMHNWTLKLPEDLVCPPNLEILLLNGNGIEEIPDTFFPSPNELRVLDLSQTGYCLPSLPQPFSVLINLHSLYLDGCRELILRETSILGKLKMLEILSMRNIRMKELSKELGGLTHLRIFDNNFGYIERISPSVISKWCQLEELYIGGFAYWGCRVYDEETEEETDATNAGFDEVISLSKLRVLEAMFLHPKYVPNYVKSIPDWVKFDIAIGGIDANKLPSDGGDSVKGRRIMLELDSISRLPKWFHEETMQIAENLHWRGCRRLDDIFVNLEHQGLAELKHLHMEFTEFINMFDDLEDETEQSFMEVNSVVSSDVQGIRNNYSPTRTWVPKKPVLKDLEKLTLEKLCCEESWEAIHTLAPGSLLNLKILEVKDCNTRGNILLPLRTLHILPNLEDVHVSWTKCGRCLFGCEDELLVSLPLKLRCIELDHCATVRMCEGPAPRTMFQNLQILSIEHCKFEGCLFAHDVAQCLSRLDVLNLSNCSLLEKIAEAGNKKTVLPKLRRLSLVGLPVLCYESATFDIECPSLEQFWVKNCPKFAASSCDFHSRKQVKLDRSITELGGRSSHYSSF